MAVMSKLGLTPAKTRRLLEAELRRAEVAREFNELQRRFQDAETRPDEDYESVFERALFAAPWRDRLHTPKDLDLEEYRYSPFYGPRNQTEYGQAMASYHASIEGGGLWDDEQVPKLFRNEDSVINANEKRKGRRYDHQRVKDLATFGKLTRRQLAVYYAYWVELLSWASIACRLNLSVSGVRWHINEIRKQAKSLP